MPSAEEAARAEVGWRLRRQVEACTILGSPLYADLLGRAAANAEAGGAVWEVLCGHESDPRGSALELRLMGAVNRLRLRGEEPQAFADWEAFEEVVGRRRSRLRELVELPVQTNEVGRSAALLFGFLGVAGATGLPLRLLEVGASAGLNLNWDRYRYEADGFGWGYPGSRLHLDAWRLLQRIDAKGARPALGEPPRVEVASREGCDADPIDAASAAGRETLLAYVWADQQARVERLRAALEVADEHPVAVEREGAAAWSERKLAEPAEGVATLLFHSIFIQYLPDGERDELLATIAAAGDRATAAAPFAWLRLEPADRLADLRLNLWPGGEERLLARAGYHGDPVELLESPW
jgi:hypothetical protein